MGTRDMVFGFEVVNGSDYTLLSVTLTGDLLIGGRLDDAETGGPYEISTPMHMTPLAPGKTAIYSDDIDVSGTGTADSMDDYERKKIAVTPILSSKSAITKEPNDFGVSMVDKSSSVDADELRSYQEQLAKLNAIVHL